MEQVPQLVYIMGRGHSGTTVLDAILGNARDIESVGELISGGDRFEALCSCNLVFRDCKFWRRIRDRFEQETNLSWELGISSVKHLAHIRYFPKVLLVKKKSSMMQEYLRLNINQIGAISFISGKPCVVDSSKEATRALSLLRIYPRIKVIHLIRNPEGIIESNLNRINQGAGFKFLRKKFHNQRLVPLYMALSSINWVAGNLLAEILHKLYSRQILRVRYEDLCQQPRAELIRIANFIGYNLDSVIQEIDQSRPMSIGHNIGGNRLRLEGSFVFDPNISSKRFLPSSYKILVRLITWPLMMVYGYNPF